MREETEFRPKPMVDVGGRPVLWHIMKILSGHGIQDFVICAGYKSEYIANYFANYARISNDFTVRLGDTSHITYHGDEHDEAGWTVTVANTGAATMTGGRIKRVARYLGDEPFFCTYGDGIADVDVTGLLAAHEAGDSLATMTVTRPTSRFGVAEFNEVGKVVRFREKPRTEDWVNIGYFVFEPAVLDVIDGDETVLEQEPLHQLASSGELSVFKHDGFWQPMDTQREFKILNDLWAKGAPWKNW